MTWLNKVIMGFQHLGWSGWTGAVVLIVMVPWVAWGQGDGAHASPDPRRITIEMKEYAFHPSKITLKEGVVHEIVLINRGKELHEFETPLFQELPVDVVVGGAVVETLGIAEVEIEPGQQILLRVIPEEPGDWPVTCRIKTPTDHLKQGMKAVLIVER